jgi:hypothetical protein
MRSKREGKRGSSKINGPQDLSGEMKFAERGRPGKNKKQNKQNRERNRRKGVG